MISDLLIGKSKETIDNLIVNKDVSEIMDTLIDEYIDLKPSDVLSKERIIEYLKTLDIFEWYEFVVDYNLEFDIYLPIVANLDNFKVKSYRGDKNDGYTVLMSDDDLDFSMVLDLWIEGGEIYTEWNQEIFNLNDLNDMITKTLQNNIDVTEHSIEQAESKLFSDGILVDGDNGYYFTK